MSTVKKAAQMYNVEVVDGINFSELVEAFEGSVVGPFTEGEAQSKDFSDAVAFPHGTGVLVAGLGLFTLDRNDASPVAEAGKVVITQNGMAIKTITPPAVDAIVRSEMGAPLGVATLGANGFITPTQLPPMNLTDVVDDLVARDALPAPKSFIWVKDARLDPSVVSGGAMYIWDGTDFTKIFEQESMDFNLSEYYNFNTMTADAIVEGTTNKFYTPTASQGVADAIGTAKSEAITAAGTYADGKVADEATARGIAVQGAKDYADGVANTAETNAKSYADTKVADEVTARNTKIGEEIAKVASIDGNGSITMAAPARFQTYATRSALAAIAAVSPVGFMATVLEVGYSGIYVKKADGSLFKAITI